MSPNKSKTISLPSGLTSRFIHVPSVVVNSTSLVGPCAAVTSHSFFFEESDFLVESCLVAFVVSAGKMLACKADEQQNRQTISKVQKQRRDMVSLPRGECVLSHNLSADQA